MTDLKINADLPDKDLIKKSEQLKQNQISQEIQELIKNYKEPDLTLLCRTQKQKQLKFLLLKKANQIYQK